MMDLARAGLGQILCDRLNQACNPGIFLPRPDPYLHQFCRFLCSSPKLDLCDTATNPNSLIPSKLFHADGNQRRCGIFGRAKARSVIFGQNLRRSPTIISKTDLKIAHRFLHKNGAKRCSGISGPPVLKECGSFDIFAHGFLPTRRAHTVVLQHYFEISHYARLT